MTVVLCGENSYAVSAAQQKLVSAFLAEHGDIALERLDGQDASFERIGEAVNSLPFLASEKMVLIKNASSNKQFFEKFEKILSDIPDFTKLVIVEGKLDKRSKFYKYLKKHADFNEYSELDERALAQWIVQFAREHQAKISAADARYVISLVGANQQLLSNEIVKLLQYDPNITRETIELLCEPTPQSSTFDLLDASLRGERQKVLQLYKEQRVLNVEPIQIIALLAWQLHMLAALVFADGATPDQVAKQLKASPYAVKKSASIARGTSRAKIRQLIGDLTNLDMRIKTESVDADDALQFYLLTMTT